MPWSCQICGEEHADQFDACWQCTKTTSPHNSDSQTFSFLKPRSLILIKIWATLASGLIAYAGATGPHKEPINIFTALFIMSLICYLPRIRWTAPLIIIGFCIGPLLFAPAINESGAQDINGAIIGAVCGMILGISLSLFNDQTDQTGDRGITIE